MSDLIKRSDAIKALYKHSFVSKDVIEREIKAIPTADGSSIDLVRCAECRWARPRTLKGETGYRCVFYRVDKAENGYCDCGEREDE